MDFSLLVKPVGSACNLACDYCFYCPANGARAPAPARMTRAVLERMLASYLAEPVSAPAVAFQGGEPLLAGEDFFRGAAAIAARAGRRVSFSVQTNGTLVTPSLARFFAAEGWLVGVSVDGPASLHDLHRRTSSSSPSHADVLAGLSALRSAGVEFNTLTLVTPANASSPEIVYRHLRDEIGARFLQFIECTSPAPYAVSAAAWGDFLCRLYDVWRACGDERRVSVRLFDTIVLRLLGGPPDACPFASDCRNYFVVENDGSVYPCDFHVSPEWRLGDVMHDSWTSLAASPLYAAFGRRKADLPPQCLNCSCRSVCQGDCVRNRAPGGPSRLCAGWRRFFDHAIPGLAELAREVVW